MTLRRALLLTLASAACRHSAPAPRRVIDVPMEVPTPVEPPWVGALARVQAAADSGHFATADSILAEFQRAQAGTPEAAEASFWRALLRADPRNPAFSPADARTAIESYVTSEGAHRRTEAGVMLRLLSLSDSLRAMVVAQRTAAEARDRARDDELQKLRDELQRTQAELDRIKRRLGPPKP